MFYSSASYPFYPSDNMMYVYHNYGSYGHVFGWGLLGFGIMVLIWVIVFAVLFRIFRRLMWGSRRHQWRQWAMGGSALEILKERYAKGEISKEEFESKKQDILSQ